MKTTGELGADGLGDHLGFSELEQLEDGVVRMVMPVTPACQQPYGIVHGGSYAALAESITSQATAFAVYPESIALGQNNDTSFLRPVTEGEVVATATPIHRGRTQWIWNVEMRNDEGKLAAISRMTIAVRPHPDAKAG